MENIKFDYLKLLIDKHIEQSSLYYARFKIFLTIFTAVIGAIVATIITGSDKLEPQFLWIIVSVESIFGFLLCVLWHSIMKLSAEWL